MTSAEARQQHASFYTVFFPLSFFPLLLCRLCKTAMAEQTGKSMILPLKNYTRIDIYHSFKLKGSEFVVWCWCLLLPGLYYYRRLSDFPFLCVPTIASNLVLPYHQPTTLRTKLFSHLQIICQMSRSPLYTHLKVHNHRTNWGTMAVFLQRNESICLLATKHSTKLKISNFPILIFSNNNK